MKPPKTVRAYAIVDPKGVLLPMSIDYSRFECIGEFLSAKTRTEQNRLWEQYKKSGYRCIPVTVSPTKKKGKKK